ncbi:uncharacterized protein LOC123270182 [Cotesia glomerata]|uniref:uncharacterized protein LOC123270182 n=1 Tax=Cotesia glomerata TaxID=32391 RepID=UPI001D013777|nr:uncharacterized protein LOC123270182 [Cotesia glomerata]
MESVIDIAKSLIHALRDNDINNFEEILNDGFDVNQVLPGFNYREYVLLHLACIFNKVAIIDILINKYQADVNLVTKYGAQPIHLTILICMDGDCEAIRLLLEAGADPNAEFTFEMISVLVTNYSWPDEFGDKLSFASYAAVEDKTELFELLTNYGADVTVRTKDNKTLLMVALENENYRTARVIVDKFLNSYPELINVRDNQDKNILDYVFNDRVCLKYRYSGRQLNYLNEIVMVIYYYYYYSKENYDERMNNDGYTELCNTASYRGVSQLVSNLLRCNPSRTGSKALSNALLPIRDTDNLFYWYSFYPEEEIETIKLEIERRKLNTVDYRKKIQDFECKVIYGLLKETVFKYGKKRETLYNLAAKIFNDRTVKPLAKSNKLIKCLNKYQPRDGTLQIIVDQMRIRLDSVNKRIRLLEESKKLSKINCIIPLPYEIILDIYEYLSNYELRNFIDCVQNI